MSQQQQKNNWQSFDISSYPLKKHDNNNFHNPLTSRRTAADLENNFSSNVGNGEKLFRILFSD